MFYDRRNPKNLQSLASIIFNALDEFICAFLDSPLCPCVDPEHVLSGNTSPVVDELPPTACEVDGPLPSCLNGAYIRNGPNPQFISTDSGGRRRPYHLLDGDGMLHVIRISGGRATFCSRYVKTHKHTVERENGYPFVPTRLLLTLARLVAGHFDPLNQGFGAANTSVALLPAGGGGGGLFAMCESDLPYRVKVTEEGDVITLGRHDFHSTEPFNLMTAHPKIDRETGEAFAYQYSVFRPFLKFFRINSDGRKQKDVAINSIDGCTVIHDFAITENYAVFADSQIVVKPEWVLRGRSPVGVDSGKVPRLGFIPKYAEDDGEMVWVDSPGLNMLHCVNAWEEEDGGGGGGAATIVVVGSNALNVNQVFENIELAELRLEKITINLNAKTVERRPVCEETVLDFGTVNPAYAGKKNRYVYAAVIKSKAIVGAVKLDLSLSGDHNHDCTVAQHLYGSGCTGGELSFVPRESNNPLMEEDTGYLITYVHDMDSGESKFLVMDAKSPTLDIIAAVKLPRRVPTGFHGLFVPETDLNKL
ncbi:hypothetical protein MIMGU_mgv1a024174mg [Erythranthe guttata]|uniref:9-cis-epoxycarotenoid dioxygenase n=1 Tax=Erythranthe guttata TaxID=4155 RepID=A0A022QK78_ERYGU|nr:hypothetical protein MIMGU_mgv1a024174mg [Erythranthe guttata]